MKICVSCGYVSNNDRAMFCSKCASQMVDKEEYDKQEQERIKAEKDVEVNNKHHLLLKLIQNRKLRIVIAMLIIVISIVACVIFVLQNNLNNTKLSLDVRPAFTTVIADGTGGEATAVKSDGSIVTANEYVEFSTNNYASLFSTNNFVAIASGIYHTVGLRSDGTVVADGVNDYGQCDVSKWHDIVAISAGTSHTVGLQADGTVVAAGNNNKGQCDVSQWRDIVAISAGAWQTVGLKSDGTVVAVGSGAGEIYDSISKWRGVVHISASATNIIGVKSDGKVVVANFNGSDNFKDVSSWRDVVTVASGICVVAGLKSDGTVIAIAQDPYDISYINAWHDVVSIAAGDTYLIGLKSDGTIAVPSELVGPGWDDSIVIVSEWRDILLPSQAELLFNRN